MHTLTTTPKPASLQAVPFIGGKSQSGVWQRIANLIPRHDTRIEPFLGSGAIHRLVKPARRMIGVDLALAPETSSLDRVELVTACGIAYLENFRWRGGEFVYCDPPYLLSTRGGRRYYRHEMTDADHERLLRVAVTLPCPVMISGYWSKMYARALAGWNVEKFRVMTRGHTWATECLWFNYPRPTLLHDLGHVGKDRRERWNIEKRRRNLRAKFLRLPPLERATLFSALVDAMRAAGDDAVLDVARASELPPTPKPAALYLPQLSGERPSRLITTETR